MAELAASVGQQLIHVDYDNNKPDSSAVRRVHLETPSGDPGCLLDLHAGGDFQCPPGRPSDSAVVATPPSAGDDATPPSVCDATSNTPCVRCGLRLHHRHHHPHHHLQQLPPPLVYGQLCVDGSLGDERYPVGLRTPQ